MANRWAEVNVLTESVRDHPARIQDRAAVRTPPIDGDGAAVNEESTKWPRERYFRLRLGEADFGTGAA